MALTHIKYDRRLLIGSELWLCIAQLGRSKSELSSNHRNQPAATAIAALLRLDSSGKAPIDQDCDDPALTRLVVLPELSLGFDDWDAVDQAVRMYDKPLVLVAGFGFTKARDIRSRVDFLEGISDDRNVNFGCVWTSIPASGNSGAIFDAQYYCKNFPEQGAELPGFDPVRGADHKVLNFDDCSIAPLICADLLADSQAQKPNAPDLLKGHRLQTMKPLIVAASVLQDKPWHPIWSSRIDRAIDGGLVLALANFSHSGRPSTYADDLTRNLSGAYAPAADISGKLPDWIDCSGREGVTAKGTVLRDSCEVLTAGVLRVANFSATTGRHLWSVRWGQRFVGGSFIRTGNRLAYEIPRLCHRIVHVPSNEPIAEVAQHLSSATDARKMALFRSIAHGPESGSKDPNPVGCAAENESTERALLVVDALARTSFFSWPASNDMTLSTNISAPESGSPLEFPVYVWRSASLLWANMAIELQKYVDDVRPRPALVVFAQDKLGTDLSAESVECRIDCSAPRDDSDFDPMTPRSTGNTVIVLPLSGGSMMSSALGSVSFVSLGERIRDSIVKAAGIS